MFKALLLSHEKTVWYQVRTYNVGHRIKRHIRGTCLYNKGQHPNQKRKTRDTCIQQCTRLLLMGMSVGREFETRHPFIFFHVLCFHFCVFLFVYLHAHGGCVPCWYVCLHSSVHACCWWSCFWYTRKEEYGTPKWKPTAAVLCSRDTWYTTHL